MHIPPFLGQYTAPNDAIATQLYWSGRALADEAVKRGIVDRLSPRHAGRLLNRGASSPTASATG